MRGPCPPEASRCKTVSIHLPLYSVKATLPCTSSLRFQEWPGVRVDGHQNPPGSAWCCPLRSLPLQAVRGVCPVPTCSHLCAVRQGQR